MADIITYPENGITYDADDASGYLSTRLSGVYSADKDFAVTANSDLTVTVSAGQAWVRPARFRGRSIIMEQPETVTLTAADAVRSRIDRLVLRYDAAARKTRLQVLEGTPDSASPTAPEITRTALVYDLCLAEIRRPAGSTVVTAADITDTRADETVCGVMRDGVTGIPTGTLVQQFRAVIDALKGEAADKLGYYPVGSIYQSTDPTSPAALFGGSWEEIASERVLMGASSTHAAGSTVKAGLPNLKGSFSGVASTAYPNLSNSGALSMNTNNGGLAGYEGGSYGSNCTVSFDASKSNAIYGRSSTVQPAAYYVHIWHRVA